PASTWRDRTPEQTLRLRLASVPGARASRKLGSAARQWPDGRATPPGLSTKGRAPQVEGEAKKPLLFQYSAKPQEVVRSSLLRLCRSCACVAGGVALGAPGPARHAPAGGEQLGAGEEEEEEEEEHEDEEDEEEEEEELCPSSVGVRRELAQARRGAPLWRLKSCMVAGARRRLRGARRW
ncbi:unnamed protein product, partial [Prorocentrum cordatum]